MDSVLTEKVAVVRIEANIEQALQRVVQLVGGIEVSKNDMIAIKPNLNDLMTAEQGVTTSVELVQVLVRYLRSKESAVDISIVESDHPGATADEEFDRLGYADISKDERS